MSGVYPGCGGDFGKNGMRRTGNFITVPVATVGPDGTPNVAPKSVMVMNPETIVWGELYFMQTYENLKTIPVHQSVSGNGLPLSVPIR
jgi:hypothetical protein